ncbi:hypothetical protein C8R44DRAFT_107804 [Mycena epipterygia]|nr:hypothetical protein C8R44DRAFT_107804 [Mycena epipterygia]
MSVSGAEINFAFNHTRNALLPLCWGLFVSHALEYNADCPSIVPSPSSPILCAFHYSALGPGFHTHLRSILQYLRHTTCHAVTSGNRLDRFQIRISQLWRLYCLVYTTFNPRISALDTPHSPIRRNASVGPASH